MVEFLTQGAGVLLLAFVGLTGLNLVSGGVLVAKLHRWRLSCRYRRDLSSNPADNARKVIGREADVQELRALLERSGAGVIVPVATVTGGAGVGKTTLARHYARLRRANYDRVEELPAATESGLVTELAALGDRLLGEAPDKPPEIRATQALEAIKDRTISERWLIVYDNVESPDAIRKWLPDGRNLHVLMTTRYPDWTGERFAVHRAGLLSPDNAVKLLEQESGRSDAEMAALAEELGRLPLALVQAGDWLAAHPRKSAAEYRKRLDALLDDWPLKPGEIRDYDATTGAAIRLSLRDLSPDARALIGVMAHFDPDRISPKIFEELGRRPWLARFRGYGRLVPWVLWAVCRNETRLSAAIWELRRKALIEDATEDAHLTERAYTIHRIVQLVVRRDLRRTARIDRAVALLAAVYPGQSAYSPQWPLCARLTPHVQALLAGGAAPEVEAWGYLLNQAGIYLDKIVDYQGYLRMAQESLRIKRARLAEDHRAIAVFHANLGVALQRLERFAEGEAELMRAIALDETHRPGSAGLAHRYDSLGGLLVEVARTGVPDRLPEAARRHQQALVLRRGLFGRRSEPVAQALNNLAAARSAQGRERAAARLFGASLAILRSVVQPDESRLALGAMNSGFAWLHAGAVGRAEPLLREALEIWEVVFAAQPEHPYRRDTASCQIFCLLVRARDGVNRGAREAEAMQLCARYGFNFARMQAHALRFPTTPEDQIGDTN